VTSRFPSLSKTRALGNPAGSSAAWLPRSIYLEILQFRVYIDQSPHLAVREIDKETFAGEELSSLKPLMCGVAGVYISSPESM
jgi:hypothetical protein